MTCCGCIAVRKPSATAFCGDDIGDIIPPMLQAKVKPSSSARAYEFDAPKSLIIGTMSVVSSTGAAMLLMNMDASVPRSMNARRKEARPIADVSLHDGRYAQFELTFTECR